MSLLNQLSSAVGDKTQEGNRQVARACLDNPDLIHEIVQGLHSDQEDLLGDCAEVLTKIAEQKPELVSSYIQEIFPLLRHKKTRVRWEGMHAIALIAPLAVEEIKRELEQINLIIQKDTSTIVRDYALDSVINYGKGGHSQAVEAFCMLKNSITLWEGKHRKRILEGLKKLLERDASLAEQISELAQHYLEDEKATVKKTALSIVNKVNRLK